MLTSPLCILALAALAIPAAASDDLYPELTKGQPKPVKALIERIAVCHHLAGEEGYDKERRRELNDSMRQHRCQQLAADEAKIAARYKNNEKVIIALRAARGPAPHMDADP